MTSPIRPDLQPEMALASTPGSESQNEDRSGFKLTWIAPPGAHDVKNCYFRARKAFDVKKIPETMELIIAAESSYIIYLNGVEIGRGPARGTRSINYYDSYQIASKVRTGGNVIGVLCHCMNIETFVAAPAEPAVAISLSDCLVTDETWEVAAASSEWRRDVMLYSVQTGFSEWRDLRQEPVGWQTSMDCSFWENAVCLSESSLVLKKRLLPRSIPDLCENIHLPVEVPLTAVVPTVTDLEDTEIAQLMTDEEHRSFENPFPIDPSRLEADSENVITIVPRTTGEGVALVFNFGREIVGRLEMEISASAGTIIDIGYDEQLCNGRLRVAYKDAKGERYDFADRYILRDGRQNVGNILMERGFRIVQVVVRNLHSPLTIHHVQAVDRRYPLEQKARFHCSDPLFDDIWNACAETLSACTTDIFTDCPWRERAFWVNDLLVENRIFLQLSGDSRLPSRALQMAFSEAASNGFINSVCPCPIEGKKDDWLALPATNLFLALILKDYYLHTGDKEALKIYLPKIHRILEEFGNYADDKGIVTLPSNYWGFFDWSYETSGHSLSGKTSAPLNFLYLIALKTYEELVIAREPFAAPKDFQMQISKLAESIEEVFFNSETGRLSDFVEAGKRSGLSSQLAHALALIAAEYRPGIRKNLIEGLNDSNLLIPELYLHYFIFLAQKLAKCPANGLERIRKYWGNIVLSGSPTIWEFGVHNPGKGALDGIKGSLCHGLGSLCHGFSTSPVDFFQTVILGIEPLQPAFKEFSLNPHGFDLEFAEGSVPTPAGSIDIAWKRSSSGLVISLEIPKGSQAITPDGRRFGPGTNHLEMESEDCRSCSL